MRNLYLLLVFSLVLSGCTEPEASVDADASDPDADANDGQGKATSDPDNGTAQSNGTLNQTNEAPVLNVTLSHTNGTAPLLVNFTVSVQDDSEAWTWEFVVAGDAVLNGTSLPAAFNHTFTEGVWNVTVSVSDGEHLVAQDIVLDVAAGVPAGPVQVVEDDFVGVVSGCHDATKVLGNLAGYENSHFLVDAATTGGTFTVAFEAGPAARQYYIAFFGEGGSGVDGLRPSSAATYSGTIPEEASYARVAVCGGGASSFHYEGFAPGAA